MTAAIAAVALAAAAAPHVEVAAVGPRGETVAAPHRVLARTARIKVGGHRCTVPRGTALAALAGERRAGGPAFRVRDDGGCGALYVTAIARHRAFARQGWVYKVGHRAGTAGAGDPAGPFGTGRRIRAGARVLWFWCRSGARGCQRTLDVAVAPGAAAPGSRLRVTVRAYDDLGRGVPAGGARVTVGRAAARTNANGIARLRAPAARGRYAVRAARRGLSPGFPGRVEVR
jgi:hypothetical protein